MLYSNFLTLNLLKISELYFCHVLKNILYICIIEFSSEPKKIHYIICVFLNKLEQCSLLKIVIT